MMTSSRVLGRPVVLALLVIVTVSVLPAAFAQTETAPTILQNAPPDPSRYRLVEVTGGFNRPLYITHAGDGSGRLFVVEQVGRIWILMDGIAQSTPFLDISNIISQDVFTGNFTERGLLGLAFHPDFAENGQFFVHYNDRSGSTVIARYTASVDDPNRADPGSAVLVLTQQQPFPNHNGGQIAFGPGGLLYIGLGDGGSAGDPQGNGQNPRTLLGSILRIDVDSGERYGIPAGNPFADNANGAPEIWAWGLRNPWRFSFDRATNDLYIADVGQNRIEEINFQPANSPGGENYGWNSFEGGDVFSGRAPASAVVSPVAEYNHSLGISVTGGYVYRGAALPGLGGVYFYGDWGSGMIWTLYRDRNNTWQSEIFMDTPHQISSFGEDEAGELHLVDYAGSILRIAAAS